MSAERVCFLSVFYICRDGGANSVHNRSETKFRGVSASVNQLENRKNHHPTILLAVAPAKGRVMAVDVPMTLVPSLRADHAD